MKVHQLPPREICEHGSLLAYQNAARHLKCARAVADIREFGPAISHLVLAEEEAVKGMVLAMYSLGVPFPPKVLQLALSRHQPRHAVAAMISILSGVLRASAEKASTLPPKGDPAYRQARDELHDRWAAAAWEEYPRMVETRIGWWETADVRKQDGLYLNYSGAEWKSPGDISEDAYREAVKKATGFMQSSLTWLLALSRSSPGHQSQWADIVGRLFAGL